MHHVINILMLFLVKTYYGKVLSNQIRNIFLIVCLAQILLDLEIQPLGIGFIIVVAMHYILKSVKICSRQTEINVQNLIL
jgi:hypothetical protein